MPRGKGDLDIKLFLKKQIFFFLDKKLLFQKSIAKAKKQKVFFRKSNEKPKTAFQKSSKNTIKGGLRLLFGLFKFAHIIGCCWSEQRSSSKFD